MGAFERGLAPDERLLLHRHKHWKTFIGGILLTVVASAVLGTALYFLLASSIAGLGMWVLVALIAVAWVAVLVWFTVAPLVRWATTHFAITDRRVMFRTGVFNTSGIDIPIARINSVQFRHVFWDRVFGTGTLIIESASDEPLEFDDIPQVESVHAMLYDELNDILTGEDDER